ncbi:MAG: glycosyltransferase [Myxococcaceae bacterium]|nr:glycosyltransferase [Myxococcaceae bacterium]MCA3011683.1 glycosyltransferase [Myxococcaceae bacterium]
MRVLHLLASPFFSGPAESLTQLALAQRARGHDVRVAVDRKRRTTPAEELAVPRLESLGLLSDEPLELSVKSSPLAIAADIARLRRLAVDVLHCHFSHDHLLARWGRPAGARLIRSVHAPRSLRRLLPRADAYTVPSEELAERLPGRRVMVLPPVVDPRFVPPASRAVARRRLELPDVPLVGMVSTFQPSRRHDVGVAAFEQLVRRRPEAQLVLLGDGALVPAVEADVRRRGLSARVHFVGYQPVEPFVQWLQALDEVWILGLGNDWAGRAAAQARSCDVRVVAVDEGALARFADAVVACDADAVATAALRPERRATELPTAVTIAEQLEQLYLGARP